MNGIFDKKGQNKTPCRFFESLGVGRAISKDTSQDRKYSETFPVKEFYLDLAVARLERAIPEAHPFQFDTRASVRVGEQLIRSPRDSCARTLLVKAIRPKVGRR